tara:strand:+ start:316 stop:441 length:126 start_codon:yes stop_codon:yes gene_type:complete
MPLANTSEEEATDKRASVSIAPVLLYSDLRIPGMVAWALAA